MSKFVPPNEQVTAFVERHTLDPQIKDYAGSNPKVSAAFQEIEDFIGSMDGAELSDGSTICCRDVALAVNTVLDHVHDGLPEEPYAADLALQEISLSLGGSDEWSDQGTMISDVKRQVAEVKDALDRVRNWLRQNANAEKEPKARSAFIEAHNAALAIIEERA